MGKIMAKLMELLFKDQTLAARFAKYLLWTALSCALVTSVIRGVPYIDAKIDEYGDKRYFERKRLAWESVAVKKKMIYEVLMLETQELSQHLKFEEECEQFRLKYKKIAQSCS